MKFRAGMNDGDYVDGDGGQDEVKSLHALKILFIMTVFAL